MDNDQNYLDLALAVDDAAVVNGQGKNKIPEPEKEPLWKRYLAKFKDPLIIVLLVALALSVIVSAYEIHQTGNWRLLFEPAGVFMAILLATGIGFIFEVKAEAEFDVLNQVKDTQPVKVLRRPGPGLPPQMYSIAKCDVVVGDLIRVESGDQMPADGELLQSNALKVDESIFTGEPWASKHPGAGESEGAYPANRLLRGSTVIEGNGVYVADRIALDSEEGRGVALTRQGSTVRTPLNRQLDQLGLWISRASFAIAALIVVGRLVFFFFMSDLPKDDPWSILGFVLQSFMIAITLIVVAVPEGLPMSVTVSLALSMRRMLKEKNLVRKLHACETMGAATVICTDKTGTLTQNRMSVVAHHFDIPLHDVALAISINTTAEINIGNPTEGALLQWLHAQGYDYQTLRRSAHIVAQQPFSSATKYMSTEVEEADGTRVRYYKGAPELMLSLSQEGDVVSAQHLLLDYQHRAMRTLGFATQRGSGPITFTGIVGIADPIRPDVVEAVRQCRQDAGVRVIIVTGDTAITANEIGRQLGLLAPGEADKTLQGPDFAARPDAELRQLLRHDQIRIVARARPEDKARLVTLLQQNREVVAVTGDGTNDAPALAKAQVGLSMGSGTTRAKEASDITLLDDSFASITRAIMWGRSLYQNIRRFILFQSTINVCACLVVLLGAVMGIDSPLSVTQMLWVNLIMDTFAAAALSALPADPRVLRQPPRSPRAHIIDRPMARRIIGVGLVFFVVLALLWQMLYQAPITSVGQLFTWPILQGALMHFGSLHRVASLTPYEHAIFFTAFVLMQFWNLFNVRYYRTGRSLVADVRDLIWCRPRFRAHFSAGFAAVAAIILVGQVLIVNLMPQFFELSPLSLRDWLWLLLATSPVFILPQLFRAQ